MLYSLCDGALLCSVDLYSNLWADVQMFSTDCYPGSSNTRTFLWIYGLHIGDLHSEQRFSKWQERHQIDNRTLDSFSHLDISPTQCFETNENASLSMRFTCPGFANWLRQLLAITIKKTVKIAHVAADHYYAAEAISPLGPEMVGQSICAAHCPAKVFTLLHFPNCSVLSRNFMWHTYTK